MQISFTRADHHLERVGKKSLISIKTFVQTQQTKLFLLLPAEKNTLLCVHTQNLAALVRLG
jgi:hypothetical protein